METKTKKISSTKISDNGILKHPTLREELDVIVKKHNEAVKQKEQFLAGANQQEKIIDRCLGAVEIIEKRMKYEEENPN